MLDVTTTQHMLVLHPLHGVAPYESLESLITMTVVFVSSLGSKTPFSRTNALSQHTWVLVMNQEERHAFLSNVQMALSFTVCGKVSSSLNRMSENVLPTAKGQNEGNFQHTSTCKTAEHNIIMH